MKAFTEAEKNSLNIFEIRTFSVRELPHRDILVWLLDSQGSHGLNNKFVRIFLSYIAKNKGDDKGDKSELTDDDFVGLITKPEEEHIDFKIWN